MVHVLLFIFALELMYYNKMYFYLNKNNISDNVCKL